MKFETPKEDRSVETIIKTIKEAKEKDDVRNAINESEKEATIEAVRIDVPGGQKEMEEVIKELELNPESSEMKETRERLKKHMAEIQEIVKEYDAVDMVNPSGRIINKKKLTYKEEISLFKEEIKKDPNYNPIFTYPEIEKLDSNDIESTIKRLADKKRKVIEGEQDENVKKIVLETIDTSIAEMNIIKSVKEKNDTETFNSCIGAYGDIDEDLVSKNETYYENKLRDVSYIDNPLRKKLKGIKISSQDLKEIFQLAFDVLGSDEFRINLKTNVENISISDTRKEIKIPENNTYTGERTTELVAHEICTHAVSMINSNEAGFTGVSIGKNVTAFKEGIAMLSEEAAGEHIFNDKKPIDKDWYIHAMDFRKKGNGFGAVYLEMKERILRQFLAQKVEREEAEKNAEKEALSICRRIFRGLYGLSSDSSYYNTKDACYFKGYVESQKMTEKGLDHYLTDLRVDPYLLPYLISLKAVPEKAKIINRKVTEAMWDKKGFSRDFLENYNWYKENIQMDRHMAYRKEFGQIDEEAQGIKDAMKKNDGD